MEATNGVRVGWEVTTNDLDATVHVMYSAIAHLNMNNNPKCKNIMR